MPFITADRRARMLLAGALAAAGLGLAASQADAAYTPTLDGRTLLVTGDAASDKLTLRMAATKLPTLELDVGADGSADFRIPAAQLDGIRVLAGEGNDEVRVDNVGLPTSVEGGDGFDTLAFSGASTADQLLLAADAGRARLTRKPSPIAIDTGTVERIDVKPLGGADTLTIGDLAGTGVQEVRPDLGDAAADEVIVNGTAQGDLVHALDGGSGSTFVIGLSAVVTLLHADPALDALTLATLGGDDRADASATGVLAKLEIDGGAGSDRLFGTAAADVLDGGDGDDVVDPGRGDDDVRLGAGNDTFQWDPGEGSDTVEGEDGTDLVQQSGSAASEQFGAAAAGGRLRLTRGPDTLDGAGFETLTTSSSGGADTVTIGDLTGTGVTKVDVGLFDFGVPGGANDLVSVDATDAPDKVTVAAKGSPSTAAITGLPATVTVANLASDRLEVHGLGGDDVIESTDLPASTSLTANGEPGDDILIGGDGAELLSGGDGDDLILAGSGDDVASGGNGDDRLRGEEGDDVLDGGAGFDVLRGGAGTDLLLGGEDVSQD
jgi:Ca2+-binding RTX toxin-like protein